MNMKKSDKTRVAIYLRVSTDEQARTGYGLTYQEEKIRAFIKSQENYVLDEKHLYKDEGYSGTLASEDRPALKKMLEDAKKGEFEVILIYKIDRLFRNTRLLLTLVNELIEDDINLRSTTEPFDTRTPQGRWMLTMMGGNAEYERELIKERTGAGRRSAAKEGKWVFGITPYGYKINKKTKKLQIVKEEAEALKMFYEWLVYDRQSLRAIARKANDLKLPVRFSNNKTTRRKKAQTWYPRTIGRILTNETYTGIAYFQKYKKKLRGLSEIIDEENLRDESDWIPVQVPQLVSPELFESAKKQLLRNRDMSERNAKYTYLFSKLLYCGKCGRKMFAGVSLKNDDGKKKGYKIYRGVAKSQIYKGSTRCRSCKIVSEGRLMSIWNTLEILLKNPKVVMNDLEEYAMKGTNKTKTKKKIMQTKQQLVSLEKKKKKLMTLYLEDGDMEYAMYKNKLKEYKTTGENLLREKAKLGQLFSSPDEKKEKAKKLKALHKQMKSRFDDSTYEEKQQTIRLLINKIVLLKSKDEVEVEINLPPENSKIFNSSKNKAEISLNPLLRGDPRRLGVVGKRYKSL